MNRIYFNEVVTRDGFQIEPEFVPTDAKIALIDELSLVVCPVIDGSTGGPVVFNSGDTDLGPAPLESMTLASHEVLDGGAMWLRYRLSS